MLAIFSNLIVKAPEELIQAGDRSPTPKKSVKKLVESFTERFPASVKINIGPSAQLSYSHGEQKLFQPRSFGAKDDIFCLFVGTLENLGSLKQHYGLAKNANEVGLVIDAYIAFRDRAPYPLDQMLRHLDGNFAFVMFDKATSRVLVASDEEGKVSMYMGITADGHLAFSDDAGILRTACGKSLAMFPSGCFFSTSIGLASYENPKMKVTAVQIEEETWGPTFKGDITMKRLPDYIANRANEKISCVQHLKMLLVSVLVRILKRPTVVVNIEDNLLTLLALFDIFSVFLHKQLLVTEGQLLSILL